MNVTHLKKQAKNLQKLYPELISDSPQGLTLSQAQAVIARLNGYPSWEALSTSAPSGISATKPSHRKAPTLGEAIERNLAIRTSGPDELVVAWDAEAGMPNRYRQGFEAIFYYVDERTRDAIEQLDKELFDDMGALMGPGGGYSTIAAKERAPLIERVEGITERWPGYIEGYAIIAGLQFESGHYDEALDTADPLVKHLLVMLERTRKGLPKGAFQVPYGFLANRPFHRLMHVYVLALEKCGQKDLAKRMARRMVRYHPGDNIGFRFWLDDESD